MVSVGLRSLRWSLVVFDCLRSLRRCLVLSGGLGWSPVVPDGLRMVSGGLRWSPWVSVVSGGLRWSPVVSGGLRWSPVVSDGLRGSP